MALPLQTDLVPWPAWQRRAFVLLALLLAVVALGLIAQARREPTRLLATGDLPGADDFHTTAVRLIDGATRRLTVVMYVMRLDDGPVQRLVEGLVSAARRGVEVRVVLDQGQDWRTGAPDPKHQEAADRLRRGGVRVVLDEERRTTHAKVIVVDDRQVVVGSHNWTRAALTANREWSLLIDDPAIASLIHADLASLPGW